MKRNQYFKALVTAIVIESSHTCFTVNYIQTKRNIKDKVNTKNKFKANNVNEREFTCRNEANCIQKEKEAMKQKEAINHNNHTISIINIKGFVIYGLKQ